MSLQAIQACCSLALVAGLSVTGCTTIPSEADSAQPAADKATAVEEARRNELEKERDAAARKRRESARLYAATADKFLGMGDLPNAEINYGQALERDPSLFEAELGLVRTLHRKGAEDAAIERLRSLLLSLSDEKDDRRIRALRREADELLQELDEVGLALADAAEMIAKRGLKAEKEKRQGNAIKLYQSALSLWPANRIAKERLTLIQENAKRSNADTSPKRKQQEPHITISALDPTKAEVASGRMLKDTTKWGRPIYNQGTSYEKGLWAPAPSRITYATKGLFKRFTAKLLVSAFDGDPSQIDILEREMRKPRSGTVRFRVIGDGRELFKSDVITYASGAKAIEVDISNVKDLTLEVTDADDGNLLDFAVWADACLYLN